VTVPLVGSRSPSISFSSVDLPAAAANVGDDQSDLLDMLLTVAIYQLVSQILCNPCIVNEPGTAAAMCSCNHVLQPT
jgi:hypothetical protein